MLVSLTVKHELYFLHDSTQSGVLFIIQKFCFEVYHLDSNDLSSVLIEPITQKWKPRLEGQIMKQNLFISAQKQR